MLQTNHNNPLSHQSLDLPQWLQHHQNLDKDKYRHMMHDLGWVILSLFSVTVLQVLHGVTQYQWHILGLGLGFGFRVWV